jgi:hypothetical protein
MPSGSQHSPMSLHSWHVGSKKICRLHFLNVFMILKEPVNFILIGNIVYFKRMVFTNFCLNPPLVKEHLGSFWS